MRDTKDNNLFVSRFASALVALHGENQMGGLSVLLLAIADPLDDALFGESCSLSVSDWLAEAESEWLRFHKAIGCVRGEL